MKLVEQLLVECEERWFNRHVLTSKKARVVSTEMEALYYMSQRVPVVVGLCTHKTFIKEVTK